LIWAEVEPEHEKTPARQESWTCGWDSQTAPTPRLDQLAHEGLRLTQFLVEPRNSWADGGCECRSSGSKKRFILRCGSMRRRKGGVSFWLGLDLLGQDDRPGPDDRAPGAPNYTAHSLVDNLKNVYAGCAQVTLNCRRLRAMLIA
jgi:hypothetical protein